MAHKIKVEGIIGFEACNRFIRRELSRAKGQDVMVEIASPGGLISEGLKMFNSLKNYEGNVDTHLTGMVASMGSYLAMVGKHRTAEKNAVFMIHNGSALVIGDHKTMFKAGKHLDSLTNIIAKEYALKSGIELDEIRSAMDETTFYYGDEIEEAGFVHEMVGDAEPEDRAEALAAAELMFNECQAEINTPELVKKDMEALATMMADEPDEIETLKAEAAALKAEAKKLKQQSQEVTVMTLAEIKEKFVDAYNQIFALGKTEGEKEGVDQERGRVGVLVEMRAKFPKAHSQKVIDEAIAEGTGLDKLTLNLMSADQVAAELAAAQQDPPPPGNGDGEDAPEMVNDEMTHPDHIDTVSAHIAALPGVLAYLTKKFKRRYRYDFKYDCWLNGISGHPGPGRQQQ